VSSTILDLVTTSVRNWSSGDWTWIKGKKELMAAVVVA
jgi:hypothetical protein